MRNSTIRVKGPITTPLTLLICCLMAVRASGADFVWDANSGTDGAQDGAGTWEDAVGNWFDETNALQNQTWSNAAGNTAVFGAGSTPGTVTVSGTVNASGMEFRAVAPNTSYTFTGGTIALATGSSISIADGASSIAGRITFNSSLSGEDITMERSGGGSLALVTLNGSNTLTGTFSLRSTDAAGLFVQANSINALPSASLDMVDVGTDVTLVLAAGGTWAVPFTLQGSGAGGRGAIRFETSTTLSGEITLAGNTLITQNTGSVTSVINSNIGETAAGHSLSLGTQGGTGTIALGGNNTFTGGLNIAVTNVRIDNANALNSAAPNVVSFSDTTAARSLTLNGFSVTVGGLSSTVTSPSITVQNASATAATLTINNTAHTLFAGILADGAGGGALSVVKGGSFAQALGGANTFTGGLTLNDGSLNINHAEALGATVSTFTINGGNLGNTSGAAITNANNNAMVWNASFSAGLASALNLGTGAVSLGTAAGTSRTVTVNSGTLTVDGAISDGTTANAVTKAGSGLLILGGSSTYTGVTSISGSGGLRITNGSALGSADSGTTVASGSRLQLENNITVNGESLITPYLQNVSGDNTWNGTIQCALGTTLTFESTAGNLLISGNVNAADTGGSAHTTNLTGAGDGEVSGVISNTFNFNKTGAGTWVLSGANTYTSATNVSGGGLQVGKAGVGQTGTGVVTVSGTARLFGTGTVRGSTFNLNSGTFLYAGDGITSADHGTLTFTPTAGGTYNLASGSTITLDLGGATTNDPTFGGNTIGSAGYNAWADAVSGAGNHDRLVFNGTSGTLTFSSNLIVLTDGYNPGFGDAFNLMDWAAALGENFTGFSVGTNYRTGADDNGSQFDLPELGAGLFWDVSRFTMSGVVLVVPEPGRMMLMTMGLALLVLRRRRGASGGLMMD